MRHLAMYNGHGCADVALANLGLKPEVTFSTEIDARACAIANYRHPHTVQLGDAFDADYTKLGHIDLLTGGSPCTYWTAAQTSHRETTCDGFGYKLFMQYVRALQNEAGSNIKTLYRILDDRVEALEFTVHETSSVTNSPLAQLHLKSNLLICCITRGDQIIIPRGGDTIQVGDSVIVVTLEKGLNDLRDILDN